MISVKRAHHVGGHPIDIEFSDGVSGVVDLRDTVSRYEAICLERSGALLKVQNSAFRHFVA